MQSDGNSLLGPSRSLQDELGSSQFRIIEVEESIAVDRGAASTWSRRSLGEFVTLLHQGFELRLLLGDASRDEFLDRIASVCSGLLDQLAQVFPDGCYALVNLIDGQLNVRH
jgi:hypothetical protein